MGPHYISFRTLGRSHQSNTGIGKYKFLKGYRKVDMLVLTLIFWVRLFPRLLAAQTPAAWTLTTVRRTYIAQYCANLLF